MDRTLGAPLDKIRPIEATDKLKTPGAALGNPSTAAACWRVARVERFAEFKSPRRWIPGGNG
jgi:hypothetical protein